MFPAARTSARPPLAPLIILLASLLLAGLLALISWRNYQHEERLRERILTQQGATLIRSFEAGARTGMMMRWREDALKTLVEETVRETEIAYIAIADQEGRILAAGGSWAEGMSLPLAAALGSIEPLKRITSDSMGQRVFEVSRQFRPRWAGRHHRPGMMERRYREWENTQDAPPPPQAIFVGLYLGEFEQARLDSLRQNILLGGLLLLVGSAGFYLLFLSQRNRVTRSTLENMEVYAESLIEGMPAGLISLDPELRIIALNLQSLDMLGYSRPELLGRPLFELVEDKGLQEQLEEGAEFIERPCNWLLGGKALPLRISASQLEDSGGQHLGTVLILRDMREILAMEEQLERARRHSALGIMATGVAHEIRNPLGTLRGFAQYFQRSSADAQACEYAGLMINEVDRLNRVISALLQFSRPREVEPGPIVPQRLCERLTLLTQEEAASRQVDFSVDYADAPEVFTGDFDLLLQMLLNLIQNGIEACSAGNRIELKISNEGSLLEIRVTDDGPGISPEDRQRIFDPFFTTRKSGTGLGLAIVSQIVEQHGGEIQVESAPRKGTRFTIRLPQEGRT